MIPLLLGVLDSAKLGHLDAHVLLQSQTVGAGGAASITFSSIPQGYRALELRGLIRGAGTDATNGDHVVVNFNGDSTSGNYTEYHMLQGNGSAAASSAAVGGSRSWLAINMANSTSMANVFGCFSSVILDYTSTSKNKVLRSLCGSDANGWGFADVVSSSWHPATPAAIVSMTISMYLGVNLAQFSRVDLYGIV